jgi:S-DNA-T family DNA segregation ATPase FtsK/SpoIIIE
MATKKNIIRRGTTSGTGFNLPKITLENWRERLKFVDDKRFRISAGLLLIFFSMFLFFSIVSFLFTGRADQSIIENIGSENPISSGKEIENWLGLWGAALSHFFIYKLFGIASILSAPLFFLIGYKVLNNTEIFPIQRAFTLCVFAMTWISMALGYFVEVSEEHNALFFLCGNIGIRLAEIFNSFAGIATVLILILFLAVFVIYFYKVTSLDKFKEKWENVREGKVLFAKFFKARDKKEAEKETIRPEFSGKPATNEEKERKNFSTNSSNSSGTQETIAFPIVPFGINVSDSKNDTKDVENEVKNAQPTWEISPTPTKEKTSPNSQVSFVVDEIKEEQKVERLHQRAEDEGNVIEDTTENNISEEDILNPTKQLVKISTIDLSKPPLEEELVENNLHENEAEIEKVEEYNYDPTLDLGRYQIPDLDLLNDIGDDKKVQVTQEELEANVAKIVETLGHFKIGISSIKATIGPTVTLYEIVPDAGIKISRIRSLEDDIALSLSALGIRIIAPIPGKGTIGIEVPNKNRQMVSLRSILATEKFANANKELPIALGKTISNEIFITDLTKMPHLLMAGATGQGKSVGLNILITSLLYKKHPAELKLVMIDPKKVELSLFNKIERHFLAALPDAEEAIITDTKKAVNVLNSLCIEMDSRYNLLKDAGVRNIKEYNAKFVNRKLNPKKGHRFLPYIVLIIDELADLMMTAGKEVELPIARLAQLARAIGIHLVIATQRPSVDVITGIIKANFPARLSFRVTSKIDSRTILDTGGADQLIGMGDMLLSNGSEIIRLQCAYVDTEEVERICDFIGSQQGYSTPYLLPEYHGEDEQDHTTVDLSDRDDMFDTAARLIVAHQQGSTSLIQRKLSLGYNRAGRIMDQLEAAGVVGPFEGSKARQVLIHDEYSLEQLINQLNSQRRGGGGARSFLD